MVLWKVFFLISVLTRTLYYYYKVAVLWWGFSMNWEMLPPYGIDEELQLTWFSEVLSLGDSLRTAVCTWKLKQLFPLLISDIYNAFQMTVQTITIQACVNLQLIAYIWQRNRIWETLLSKSAVPFRINIYILVHWNFNPWYKKRWKRKAFCFII